MIGAASDAPPRGRRAMRSPRFRAVIGAYLRGTRWRLALATLCMLGGTITTLLAPWPLKLIFDHVLLDAPLPHSSS